MSNTRYRRQLDLIDPRTAKEFPITIIGAGGIGSWTALSLAKSGFKNITVYDHDVLEEHNISNQAYPSNHVGESKVESLNSVLNFYGADQFNVLDTKFEPGDQAEGVLVMAVDSIGARKEIFEAVQYNPDVTHIVDGRMGLSNINIFTFSMSDTDKIKRYKEEELDAEDVAELPCTARTTVGTATTIGGMMTMRVVSILNDDEQKFMEVYDIKNQFQISE